MMIVSNFWIQQVNMNNEAIQNSQLSLFIHNLVNMKSDQSAKAVEAMLKVHYANIQFLFLLKDLMMSPHTQQLRKDAVIKIKTTAAILLNRCFVLQKQSNTYVLTHEQSVQFFYQLLFNMDISINIKRMFQPSFTAFLTKEEIQLADFFQEAFQKLVRMVKVYDSKIGQLQNKSTTFVQQITFKKEIPSFQIVLNLPTKLRETYDLIIFLANTFLNLFLQRGAVYQRKILESWKMFHTLLFRQQIIQINHDIVLRALVVWDNFIFDGLDLNRQLFPSYKFIYDWEQLSKDLIFLLNYKSLKIDESSNTYNYFFINQDCENPLLVQLKQKAIDIFSNFLKLLQAVQLSEEYKYSSPFFDSLQQIEKSLLASIKYSVKHQKSTEEQTLEINLLNLFSIWVQLKSSSIDEEMRIHYTLQLVIPMIQYEVKLYEDIFGPEDRGEELITELNDCCQCQKQQTKLSNTCRILQELVDSSNQLYLFIKQYALQSIITSKIEDYQLETSFNISSLPRISNPTAFLLLSVIVYNDRKHQNGLRFRILAQLINQTYFPTFQNYEKQYFLFFLGFTFEQVLRQNKPSVQYLMNLSLSNQYGLNVKRFAFDFLVNVCDYYYSHTFTAQFLQNFLDINIQSKWSIACKMLRKFLHHIDENILCSFVQSLLDQAVSEARVNSKRKMQGQSAICRYANMCISTCRQLSHSYDSIDSKPKLQRLLLNSIQYLRELSNIDLDDELIGICADSMDTMQSLPDNLMKVLQQMKYCYFNNQYRGRCYHSFYAICLELTNNQAYYQDSMKQIQAIYDILIEALGYFRHFPEDLNDDQFEGISSHVFLLQKLYIIYGDRLQNRYQQQTLQICDGLISRIGQNYQPLLLSRITNMILLCKITIHDTDKVYPIQEIYNFARNNIYLFTYDCSFLIFLLGKIFPVLTQEQRSLSVIIVIAVCDSWKNYSRDRNIRAKNRLFRQNTILSHVLPPVTLENNPIEQMKIYINQLSQFNPEWFQAMKASLTQSQITKLSAFYGQTQVFFVPESQAFDQQEGSCSDQSNEATFNDLNSIQFTNRSRKIIKVSRQLQATPSRMVDVPSPVKRNHHKDESCIDQQEPMKRHGGKKLKIQSAIVHEVSKREILNEKIAKKSQRA